MRTIIGITTFCCGCARRCGDWPRAVRAPSRGKWRKGKRFAAVCSSGRRLSGDGKLLLNVLVVLVVLVDELFCLSGGRFPPGRCRNGFPPSAAPPPRRRSFDAGNIACFCKKCKKFRTIYLSIFGVSFLSALRAGSGLFVSPHVRQFLPPVRACAPPKQRAGPLRRLPPAAAGAARLTRRDGHASLSQAPLYIDTRNAQKVAPILHFSKKIFSRRGGWGQKFFASWWDGDETGEKRAAARWENRSVVPQGMGIKMRRNRAGLPEGPGKNG